MLTVKEVLLAYHIFAISIPAGNSPPLQTAGIPRIRCKTFSTLNSSYNIK
jgi:hypothetical protein